MKRMFKKCVGLEAGEAARLDDYLNEKVKEVPNVEKMHITKGVGMSTLIGFL